MDNSTYVALSLAQVMRRELDVTANNIANANTAGFKGEHIVFDSYLYDSGESGAQPISFVTDAGSFLDNRQGPLSQTGNPLDVGLLGKGFMSYRTPEGQLAYGRDGQFTVDARGNLVTMAGNQLLDAGGTPIALPQDAGEISIARDGTISGSEAGVIAQIGVFDLPDLQGMLRLGNGMLGQPEDGQRATQMTALETEVVQGSVEASNVEPVTEMTRMMEIQRSYERAVNLMSGEDDLRRDTLRRIGQIR